ncbi:hypothetical protein ACFW5X_22855 [Streptomyces albogriseolus]|uniref:hypothetical protein n=1 Tax=Streptomyces TaxID=1883 RepID=UPI002A74F7D9|nr:hypothetical protein [Streptomyces sp. CL7]WPP31759.1 hypothetical protein SJH97_21605 [Streptomyces sp. CL7]
MIGSDASVWCAQWKTDRCSPPKNSMSSGRSSWKNSAIRSPQKQRGHSWPSLK